VRSEDDGRRELLRGIRYLKSLYHEGVAPSVDDATKSHTAALHIPERPFFNSQRTALSTLRRE